MSKPMMNPIRVPLTLYDTSLRISIKDNFRTDFRRRVEDQNASSLNLSLRGARQCDEAIFCLRRLLRPCGARNDIWVIVITSKCFGIAQHKPYERGIPMVNLLNPMNHRDSSRREPVLSVGEGAFRMTLAGVDL